MKRTQKYLSSEAHGYLREAEACSLVLKDLERISAKLQRRIDKEAAARQADFEAAMQYHSEAEIQDAYGWEFITEAQYSYFTLSFNENQTVKKRAEVCWRLLQFLEHRFRKNRNLDVAVQHSIWYDHEKICKDADRMKCLLADRSCTYGSKDGKFLFDDGIFCFRPKYAKRQLYRVSDSEVLALCWKLGLTDDTADGSPLATGRHSA